MTVPPSVTTLSSNSPVAARSSAIYQATLVDENGAAIPASALTTLVLSLYDKATGAVVNGISDVDILNTGRGTVDSSGNLTITFAAADMTIVGSVLPGRLQWRSLVIDFTYNSGTSTGRHQADFPLVELAEP